MGSIRGADCQRPVVPASVRHRRSTRGAFRSSSPWGPRSPTACRRRPISSWSVRCRVEGAQSHRTGRAHGQRDRVAGACRSRIGLPRAMKGCRLEGQVSPGVQGGPVPGGAKAGPGGAACMAGAWGGGFSGNARSRMSHSSRARLPPNSHIACCTSRHSGWLGRMPRSRWISAMTAPMGRRRTRAAICSAVGRWARRGSEARRRGGGRPGLGRGSGRARPWSLVQPGGAAEHSRLKRLGEVQAADDAREDHRKIGSAEAGSGEDGIGGDALADRGCECRAVVDQLADEGEQAAGAAGLRLGPGGWLWGGGCGWTSTEQEHRTVAYVKQEFTLHVSMTDRGRRRSARYPVCPDTVGVTAP